MKVLILKPSSLGDVIQAIPVARLIKRRLPEAEIHWWIDADLIAVFEDDPDVSRLIAFHRRRWSWPQHWHELVESTLGIRRSNYDWVIDLQGLARSGIVAWFSGAALTIGLDDSREGASVLYDARIPRPTSETHAADWYLEVLRFLGVPIRWDFEWLPRKPRAAEAIRGKWAVDNGPWVTLHPGARWLTKRWPADYWAQLVRLLARKFPRVRFAVLGGSSEAELGRTIVEAAPESCANLTGQTDLAEMIEWIRSGVLHISNDSGPMHAAAAMGKPVLALFGPTNPRRTGPYRQLEGVVQLGLACVPCMQDRCPRPRPIECLRALDPEQVFDIASQRLGSILLGRP